ncbi:Chitin synthase, class 1, partial [Chytridiales sp. JEL 0842]
MSYNPHDSYVGGYPTYNSQQQQQQQPQQQNQYYLPETFYQSDQQQQQPQSQQQQQPTYSNYGNFPPPPPGGPTGGQGGGQGYGFQQQEPSQAVDNFQRLAKLVQREIQLQDNGAFIIDLPVSKNLLNGMPYTTGEEFTHLRYTACVDDASAFPKRYTLRQGAAGRRTRIAVVVTMYNEDDELYGKTMTAIMKNIAFLCSGRCAGWDKDGWKEVVVCVVSDGRAKLNPKTANVMALQGCYNKDLPKASVNGKPVTAHIFEYTSQIAVTRDLKIRRPHDKSHDGLSLVPCQTIFVLKEKNAKKINSHRWFFQAVCESLQPEVTILIDVGTKPTKESFFHLYKAFNNPMVAGACGEIAAELGPYWRKALANPIVAVQNFEYKMSNILDKPLESVFGYISVLPGAFSAYRYTALKGRPLECYFKGESSHGRKVSEANMYLAEDRILCFELVMKSDAPWVLKYVKSAKAETDVPSEFTDLIKQRRRWLNGSFFASVYATQNWMRIGSSAHSRERKIALYVEFFYNFVNLCFAWFNIANFYLSFYFLFNPAKSPNTCITSFTSQNQPNNGDDPFFPAGPIVFDVLKSV